ncbi:hypothetical protein Patl1_15723 [Pistacia atlantica]|uniref:Uncharacterized protein n=1 Tax=Pistacia atlantica TaxID=434234 RepID=A0ACC1B5K1_9ROSI|nr:hypothetical protein Patl1_15723 [Pistacia atlantica]
MIMENMYLMIHNVLTHFHYLNLTNMVAQYITAFSVGKMNPINLIFGNIKEIIVDVRSFALGR